LDIEYSWRRIKRTGQYDSKILVEQGVNARELECAILDEKVTYNQIVGKKVLHIPFLGWLIKLIRSGIFSVLCILILFVMFLENKAKMRRKKQWNYFIWKSRSKIRSKLKRWNGVAYARANVKIVWKSKIYY